MRSMSKVLMLAADLIGEVPDEAQRTELGAMYRERVAGLEQ